MPRRIIYVLDNDQRLFEQATREAGSLPPVIVTALKEYMARAKLRHEGMDTIDLAIGDHGVSYTAHFTGRKLFRLVEKADNRVRVRFVYTTKQGRYAVYKKITADSEDWEGQGGRLWCDLVTWTRSFWLRSDRTLDTFDTLDQLCRKDPELVDRIAVAQEVPAFRELDIQTLSRRPYPAPLPDASGSEYSAGPISTRKKCTNTHYLGP